MRSTIFLVLLLVLAPALVSANDEGKSKKWWSTPLIIVIYIGFFLVAAGVALCIRHYRDRQLHLDYHNGQHRGEERGLDAEEIDSLPSLRFSEMKMHRLKEGDQQLECAVCLSEFKDQEVLRILPDCLHVFHPSCIAPWLTSHVTCPICRSSLEHRQGSSASMSSVIDSLSGPISQRFGHSIYYQNDHEDDNDDGHDQYHDDHVEVDIDQGSSTLHSEVNLDGPRVTRGIGNLHRSHSTGDLIRINRTTWSTSWSTILPKESSPKSDYRTTLNKGDQLSCISPKSDSSIDYSSLTMLVQMRSSTVMSASHVASVPES